MGQLPRTARTLLLWMALVSLLSGCQSLPVTGVAISSDSSLLAVDVVFPAPLSRDPSLVQVFFARGPIHDGLDQLPDLIPATFVKWDRAYLLDPEPGTYSVVAVTSAYAPPWNDYRIVGVSKTTWNRTSSEAMIFPAELIHRTMTTVGPGRVAFMGTLHVRQGDRINSKTVFQDDLQQRIAERLRPGVTSRSGLAGWLKRTRMVNLEKTSFSNEVADQESFFSDAPADLGDSPWAAVIARAAPRAATIARARARPPSPKSPVRIPEAVAAESPPTAGKPEAASVNLPSRTPGPEASPPGPEPRAFSGLPPDSLLSEIEFGMRHHDVRKILGTPDDRIDRLTAKAWIPFYNGPGANLRDWIYEGKGRVIFSLYQGKLEVIDVVYNPDEGK
ncbi:MAG: hypothetical protein JRG90_12865 [Deltaproteobacteria bacterium]|nr:hypothetical protein [Deltaproteobacteria bacterium]